MLVTFLLLPQNIRQNLPKEGRVCFVLSVCHASRSIGHLVMGGAHTLWNPSLRLMPSVFQVGLPSTINLSLRALTGVPVSIVILNLVKLATKINFGR